MDIIGFTFGVVGIAFGLMAWIRTESLEKKLKELNVIPNEYDSLDNSK